MSEGGEEELKEVQQPVEDADGAAGESSGEEQVIELKQVDTTDAYHEEYVEQPTNVAPPSVPLETPRDSVRTTSQRNSGRSSVRSDVGDKPKTLPADGDVPRSFLIFMFVSAILSAIVVIMMVISLPLPWYFDQTTDKTVITTGKTFEYRTTEEEYFYTLSYSEKRSNSKDGTTYFRRTNVDWKDSKFSANLLPLIRATTGLAASFLGLSAILLAFNIIVIIACFKEGLRSKLSLRMWLLILNIIAVLTFAIALVTMFVFFDHPRQYKKDWESAGFTCDKGSCNSFFWTSSTSTAENGVTETTELWGPDSGWILFAVSTILMLVVTIFTSPLLSPGVSEAPRILACLP